MVIVKEWDSEGNEILVFRKASEPTKTSSSTYRKPRNQKNQTNQPKKSKAEERLEQPLEQRLESAKRTICWILRHGAIKLGMDITTDGFVYLDDLIIQEDFKKFGLSPDQVKDLVLQETKNSKFYDIFVDNDSKVNVRAKWGHSMEGISTKLPKIVDNSDQVVVTDQQN